MDCLRADGNQSHWFDSWIVIYENKTKLREMVWYDRKDSIVIYGSILSIWAVLWNSILAIVVATKRQRDYVFPVKWLILNFTFAQFTTAAFVVPLNVKSEWSQAWTLGVGFCRLWQVLKVVSVSLSVWALFMITLDRFFYVVQPINYTRKMGGRKVIFLIVLSWVVAGASLLPLILSFADPEFILEEVCGISMTKEHAFALAFGAFFAPGFMTVVVTMAIVVAAIQAKMQQARLRSDGVLTDEDKTCAQRLCYGRCCPDVTYVTYAEYHDVTNVAVTITTINVLHLSLLAPMYAINVLIPFCEGFCVDPVVWSVLLWLAYTSCGITPLLWLMDRDIRSEFKDMVKCGAKSLRMRSVAGNSWYFVGSEGSIRTYKSEDIPVLKT